MSWHERDIPSVRLETASMHLYDFILGREVAQDAIVEWKITCCTFDICDNVICHAVHRNRLYPMIL